jgi:hypothetical protein
LLRQGEESPDSASALRFVDDFIASTAGAHDPESRAIAAPDAARHRTRAALGLANVAFQDSRHRTPARQLHTYYRQQLGEVQNQRRTTAAVEDSLRCRFRKASSRSPSAMAELEDEPPTTTPSNHPPDSPESWQQVRRCKPGTWLEFSTSRRASSAPSCRGSAR